MKKIIAILGSNGYIGSSLCKFLSLNYKIIGISKNNTNNDFCDEFFLINIYIDYWYTLIINKRIDFIINCAFDFHDQNTDLNLKYKIFFENLNLISKYTNCKFINISSTSSFETAKSIYGKEKLYIEKIFTKFNSINVRVGLVCSCYSPGSAFKKLINSDIFCYYPIIKCKDPSFFVCDIIDLMECISYLLLIKINKSHTITFCYRNKFLLSDIKKQVEIYKNKQLYSVYINWKILYLLLIIKEFLFGIGKIRSDSIIDFVNQNNNILNRCFFSKYVLKKYYSKISFSEKNKNKFYLLEQNKYINQ